MDRPDYIPPGAMHTATDPDLITKDGWQNKTPEDILADVARYLRFSLSGCICPAGANLTCAALTCPRRLIDPRSRATVNTCGVCGNPIASGKPHSCGTCLPRMTPIVPKEDYTP